MPYRKPIPPLLQQSQTEKIAELQRREFDLAWQVTHPFERLLRDWRTRIEHTFLRAFVVSLRPDRQAVWDPTIATPAFLEDEILRPLRQERATIEQEIIPVAQERQRNLFLLGAMFARWQLALGGVDAPEPLPSPHRELGSIGGVGLRGRMTVWGQVYQAKADRAIRAAAAGQLTLSETLAVTDHVSARYEQVVSDLARNEGYRAAAEGERAAVAPFRDRIDELWVCRPDACRAICWPRHLTLTPLIPIRDSHPSCRCQKLPIVRGFQATPQTFTTFATRYDQRPLDAF